MKDAASSKERKPVVKRLMPEEGEDRRDSAKEKRRRSRDDSAGENFNFIGQNCKIMLSRVLNSSNKPHNKVSSFWQPC